MTEKPPFMKFVPWSSQLDPSKRELIVQILSMTSHSQVSPKKREMKIHHSKGEKKRAKPQGGKRKKSETSRDDVQGLQL